MSEPEINHQCNNHDYRIIAINENFYHVYPTSSNMRIIHCINFLACSDCGHRNYEILSENLNLATRHVNVISEIRLWQRNGIIRTNPQVTWFDAQYQTPGQQGEHILNLIQNDPTMSKLLENNPSVKSAFDNLESIVKLSQ